MSSDDDTDPLGPTGLAEAPRSATSPRSPSQQRLHDDVRGALFQGERLPSREYEPGEVLGGRYRIVGQLGRGGMGVVYRANDLVLGESVAIKFLPAEVAERPDYIERFVREVRTARKVTHGNVCRVHDIGEVDGRRFLSMEYVDGEDLASLLRRIGRLDHDKAVELSHQLCAGLAALHDQDIIHRDLKPANVMIDGSGHLKLADFGLAALVDEFGKEEIRDGTPAYQAPEQARGEAVTKASDIYALGLILDEMFSGSGRSRAASKTSSETSRARVDPEIAELIDRCLQDDPSKRPGSVREAALALPGGDPLARALAQGQLLSADAVANAPTAGALRPSTAWGIAAAVLFFVLGVAVLQTRSSPTAIVPPLDVAVLEHRAAELLETLVAEPPKVRTVFAAYDHEAGERVAADESVREDPLFDPFRLVIRANAKRISAQGPQITLEDPPAVMPGTTTVSVDGAGDLRGLLIVPREDDPAVVAAGAPDWGPALEATGFDPATLQPSTPSRAPPTNVDEVAAWTTADGGGRIEAGARGGNVVWLTVERAESPEDTSDEDSDLHWGLQVVMIAFRAVFVVIVLIAFPVAAVRTLRDGGSDFTGARRLAYAYLALTVVAHVTASPISGVHATNDMILSTIGGAALAAVGYVVIEPFVRRRMPRALVGWNRLLRGRFSDPLVGRELLVGLALGVALAGGIGVLASFGHAMTIEPETLLGGRRATSILWSSMLFGPSTAMLLLAVLLVIQWRVKNRWVAGLLVVLGVGLNSQFYGSVAAGVLFAAVVAFVAHYGLLAATAAATVSRLALAVPMTDGSRVSLSLDTWPFFLVLVAVVLAWISSRGARPSRAPS